MSGRLSATDVFGLDLGVVQITQPGDQVHLVDIDDAVSDHVVIDVDADYFADHHMGLGVASRRHVDGLQMLALQRHRRGLHPWRAHIMAGRSFQTGLGHFVDAGGRVLGGRDHLVTQIPRCTC